MVIFRHIWLGLASVQKYFDCFFRSQKNLAAAAAKTHLLGVAEWSEPKGGMFLWIKVPGIADTKAMIEEKAMAKEVNMRLGKRYWKSRGETQLASP